MKSNLLSIQRILLQLNYILNKQQKKRSVIVFFVAFISSFLELLGIAAILPFIQAIMIPEEMLKNDFVAFMVSAFRLHSRTEILLFFGIALVVVYVGKNLCLIFSGYIQADYSTRVTMELAQKMFNSYMTRPYTFFLNVNSSEIQNGIMQDMSCVCTIIASLFSLLAEMMTLFFICIYIIKTDVLMACGAILIVIITLLALVLVFKPKLKMAGKNFRETFAEENKCISQTVNGIKEIFVLQKKDCFSEQFVVAAEKRRKANRLNDFINCCPDRIVEGVCISGLILFVCIRVMMGTDNAQFVSQLAMFAMAAFRVLPSIGKITNRINTLVYYRLSLQNAYDIIKSADEFEHDREEELLENITEDLHHDIEYSFNREIRVENVSWKYPNSDRKILDDASMVIRKGESVALIGKSGAGKSTLADIILGLLLPQEGTVKMDGVNIYSIPKSWSKIIGYVPQMVFLMDDTIRNNIVFDMKVDTSNDDKIWRALEQAQLKEFVENLPDQLNTIVGERGIKFSGGQRQRIAIARALYNDPDILILDEATSALDMETENVVMESIDALHGKKTLIIIAHRLSTIENCDKVYEVGNGKICLVREENTHIN